MGRSRVARLLLLLAWVIAAHVEAQDDATTAFPHNYKLLLDNPDVAVLRVHYGAHEFVGVHGHPAVSTVYVYLNDGGAVSFRYGGKEPVALVRPPTRAGSFRVSPGRIERHAIQSLSDQPSEFLRIELKHLPVHSFATEYRGAAPTLPLIPGSSTPYSHPALRVERIICGPKELCVIAPEAAPSVLVAIPSGAPITASHHQKLTIDNPIVWLPANMSTRIKSKESVDLLRIDLLKQ